MLAALVLLVRVWRRNPDEGPGLLPVAVYRFGSVLALLSFSATGCIVVPQTQDGSEYLLAANGLSRGTSEGGESNIMSVLGAFYYVSTHNGSTDIVTNADGAPVARFVYEPFGKVNSDLTDLDPDRNGVHYGEQFQFTGQEYEPETGLYNYKARIYDPETGRFLQPDPVHSENAGYDNWDRYQYANNNPVNFIDPTGESWLSGRLKSGRATGINYFFHNMNRGMKGIAHKFNGGLRGIAHKFNSSLRGITHNINNSVKTIGHKIDHAYKSKEAGLYLMFKASGMTEEEISWMLAITLFWFKDKGSAYFTHRYTGHEGNRDPFHAYYIDTEMFFAVAYAIAGFLNKNGMEITDEKLGWFLLMIPLLSPKPVSFADGLAVRHDREWPSNKRDFKGIFDANNHYIAGWFKGIGSKKFWQKPFDSIVVGGSGTVLFLCMNYGMVGGCPL